MMAGLRGDYVGVTESSLKMLDDQSHAPGVPRDRSAY